MTKYALSPSAALQSLLCCWLWAMFAACTPTPTPPPTPAPVVSGDEEIAIVTYVSGTVTLLGTGSAVKAFQVLKEGSRLQVAADAKVTVVCFQERVFAVDQSGEVEVTQQCANATSLPANTAQYVKPDGGRIVLLEGSLALEEQAREREGDYGNIPIILSPRNTSLLDLQPTITWVEVNEAIEYQLSLSGLSSFDDVILSAETVTCVEESRSAPSRACSTPWPTTWSLEPGQRYFLTVNARTGIASPLRESEASALRTLVAEEAKAVQTADASTQALPVDEVTKGALLAGVYIHYKLYSQAIEAYEQMLSTQPTPDFYVTLGDLYRSVELYRYAFDVYQQTLDLLDQGTDDPFVRAAAEFGIGQVYYARQNFDEAVKHYRIAEKLYKSDVLFVSPNNRRLVDAASTGVIEGETR